MKNKTLEYLTMSKPIILLFIWVNNNDERRENGWKWCKKKQSWECTFPHAKVFECPYEKHKKDVSYLIIAFLLKLVKFHPTSSFSLSFHPFPSLHFFMRILYFRFMTCKLYFSISTCCFSFTTDLGVKGDCHS